MLTKPCHILFEKCQLSPQFYLNWKCLLEHTTQLTFPYSKSTIETLEKDVKYVQS